MKKTWRVFHAVVSAATARVRWLNFTAVAEVQAETLEEVFERTQHIRSDWAQNEGVRPLTEGRRSTSVGDVVIAPDGVAYRCDPVGWSRIPEKLVPLVQRADLNVGAIPSTDDREAGDQRNETNEGSSEEEASPRQRDKIKPRI